MKGKMKLYRDKHTGCFVEIEIIYEHNIGITYSNGSYDVTDKRALEFYEEVNSEDFGNDITGLEKMLYLAVKHYIDSRGGLEDHHAILDIMDMIQCSRSFAEMLVKKLIKDKAVIDTGEFK